MSIYQNNQNKEEYNLYRNYFHSSRFVVSKSKPIGQSSLILKNLDSEIKRTKKAYFLIDKKEKILNYETNYETKYPYDYEIVNFLPISPIFSSQKAVREYAKENGIKLGDRYLIQVLDILK